MTGPPGVDPENATPFDEMRALTSDRSSGGWTRIESGAHAHALEARGAGSAAPLFCVPTGLGDVAYVFELARHLDCDAPVYALPWPTPLPATLEALAEHMVRSMKEVQPQGAYRLLGWSTGGLLAYAMAQRLAELDEPVGFVGLLNCDYDPGRPGVRSLDADRGVGIEHVAEASRRAAHYATLWSRFTALPIPGMLDLFQSTQPVPTSSEPALRWMSLLAPERIRQWPLSGSRLSVLDAPSIASVGDSISQAVRSCTEPPAIIAHSPMLLLQSGNRGVTPVICIPGAGDNVTSFVAFSNALDRSLPMLGMQPRGATGSPLPYGNVQLAATRYLQALRAQLGARKAVHLLGHSFGGWVAIEMAIRMAADGVAPASVTLVDVDAPHAHHAIMDRPRAEVLTSFLGAIALRTTRPLDVDVAHLDSLRHEDLIREIHQLLVRLQLVSTLSQPDLVHRSLVGFSRCMRTCYHAEARYEGLIHLVQVADARDDEIADAQRRTRAAAEWRRVVAELNVWHGPGNHMTILSEPHVSEMARWWRQATMAC